MLTVGTLKEWLKDIPDDVEIKIGTVYYPKTPLSPLLKQGPVLHNCECLEVVFDTNENEEDIVVISPYATDFEEMKDENEQNESEEE